MIFWVNVVWFAFHALLGLIFVARGRKVVYTPSSYAGVVLIEVAMLIANITAHGSVY